MKTFTKPAKVTAAQSRAIKAFGLDPASFSVVVTMTKPKRFELTLTDAAFVGCSEDLLNFMKPLKSKGQHTDEYDYWVVPGVGIIIVPCLDDPYIEIRPLKDADIPEFIIEVMNGEDSYVRWKEYGIDAKAKTIIYQCYEHRGKSEARKLLKRHLKAFGLSDWKLDMPTAHWGTL